MMLEVAKCEPKAEPEDLSSLYDLEYKSGEDDAWYSVSVGFDAAAETLTVKYLCFPEVHEALFSAREFETEIQVDMLVGRFRPPSQQLQDHQCRKLAIGTTVCAAYGIGDNDLKFYDAIVEAVKLQPHSFGGGEEECLCTFVLFWQHGYGRGTLTSCNISSICTIEPVSEMDSRICAFATLAKEKIAPVKSIPTFDNLGSKSKGSLSCKSDRSVFIAQSLETPQCRVQEMETGMTLKSSVCKSEDSGMFSCYNQWESQDKDIGPGPCTIDGSATTEGYYFIVIDNIEKDLTPASIKKFIHLHTSILPQAFVFPRMSYEPFARGAVMIDCQKKVQIIYEFLKNPNHLIVSSGGRPWVITEKAVTGKLRTMWNFNPVSSGEFEYERAEEELELVCQGTDTYKRAKQLRDLFMEYIQHESHVCEKLVLEEKRVLQSSHPDIF